MKTGSESTPWLYKIASGEIAQHTQGHDYPAHKVGAVPTDMHCNIVSQSGFVKIYQLLGENSEYHSWEVWQ